MKGANKITTGLDVNLNKLVTLYHTIWGFINMKQGEAEHNDNSKLRSDKFYNTTELAGEESTLQSKQITKSVSQASD